jgi:Ca2+-binding RTX toxin-like protein
LATVVIHVRSINDAPVVVADSFVMDQGTTLNGSSVLANDSDYHDGAPSENNAPLVAQLVTGPGGAGLLTLNADGTFVFTPVAGFSGTATFTYVAVDSLGGVSAPAIVSIEVRVTGAVTMGPDPCDVTKTALVVRGTATGDQIHISPAGNSGSVEVTINGVSQGVFSPTGRVIVRAGDGDDNVQVAGSISLSVWAYGEGGNDRVKGGAGSDVLIGGTGDDLLVGGSGRDLLIGGWGADRLVGDAHDDILIAGATDFDANEAAICDIMDEWTSGRDYGVRVQNLLNGGGSGDRLNGLTFLNDQTVHDDGAVDLMTGSAGQDWFLFNQDGDNGAAKDKITDLHAQEFANDIDFINGP